MKRRSGRTGWLAFCLLVLMAAGGTNALPAQTGGDPGGQGENGQSEPSMQSLADLSLEELLEMKVTVAAKTAQTVANAPGIVTLITREEIRDSGARDLIDVLRLVPGFEFGIDVRGVTSIGIRGNWAHEGKVLLLWDGQMMNEVLFPSVQIGNHYPVELIERIEIIRGPGSVMYGGDAELGVINIITTPATELDGVYARTTFGWMREAFGRHNTAVAVGDRKNAVQWDLALYSGHANRSDREMTDYHPENPHHTFAMAGEETIDTMMLNTGLRWQGLRGRLIIDRYHLNDRTMYGVNLPSAPRIDFITYIADLQYEIRFSERLRLTPRLNYTQNTPWQSLDRTYSPPIYLDKWAERFSGSLVLEYRLNPACHLLTGVELYKDIGHAGEHTYFNRRPWQKRLEYFNSAVYMQGILQGRLADLTVGTRYEKNSKAGDAFVPRAAITKRSGDFHFKVLYSHAFRSPGIENISRYASTPIGAEKTRVFEVEAGYRLGRTMSLTANLFRITIKKPIIFSLDPILNLPAYYNGTRTGTTGFEAAWRLKSGRFSANATYSFYRARRNEVPDYVVLEDEHALLGFPRHKLTLDSTLHAGKKTTANLTGTYLGKRYADNDVGGRQFSEDPVLLLNLVLSRRDVLLKGLTIGLGVYNLTSARYSFIQPYKGGSAPLPGPSREIMLSVAYERGF